jgi:transcription initiation factor IIE alpha subunit
VYLLFELMSNPILIAETLVSTVARAFYTDTVVVVLEGLMQEKYIIEEELGPRLKLGVKEVRKVLTQLESELLIKVENVLIDDTKSYIKCYYIDFQQFVDSVRYRAHLMQKAIVSDEKTELNEVFFQCPTCKETYSSLQAQNLLSGDFKFVCPSCCPLTNFRNAPSEAYYRLVEVDNTGKLNKLQVLEKKLEEQMNKSNLHDGIFDMLAQLRDCSLSHNLPSQNILKGVRGSKVTDERVAEEIKQNFEYATGQFGGSLIKKKTKDKMASGAEFVDDSNKTEFKINIESESSAEGQENGQGSAFDGQMGRMPMSDFAHNSAGGGKVTTSQKELLASLPHFLQDSRVVGATEMLKQAKSLQGRVGSSGGVGGGGGEDENTETAGDAGDYDGPATKRFRPSEDNNGASINASNMDGGGGAEGGDGGDDGDDDDDVAWESEPEGEDGEDNNADETEDNNQ